MDDLFGDKKEETTVLDLSKCSADTKEEFKRLLEQVPDYKTRPIKVRQEEIRIREKNFKFRISKKRMVRKNKEANTGGRYKYQNPIPIEMQSLKMEDLYSVPIDWRMLTTLRPKNKVDEEYFSRLVELGKASMKALEREKTQEAKQPDARKTKNRAGVIETRLVSCAECLEELCDGKNCYKFTYDMFARPDPNAAENQTGNNIPKTIAPQSSGAPGGGTGGGGARGKSRNNQRRPRTVAVGNSNAKNKSAKGNKPLRRSKSVGPQSARSKSKTMTRSKSLGRKQN
ncbi:uncharacterized protein LOC113367892 [Ctenocephalides felis]|uniref:uncharacterized protein LOC113367892 n=1 Tax=Ctenocephalides felis TaxID=7515 RepID=UPI000E6E22BA|nr:uncharacterized protein LOC113367892 [Ctenocephalides felis]